MSWEDEMKPEKTIDGTIDYLEALKGWVKESDIVVVEMKRGLREKPDIDSGAMEFEDNRTRTLRLEVNGGARDTRKATHEIFRGITDLPEVENE